MPVASREEAFSLCINIEKLVRELKDTYEEAISSLRDELAAMRPSADGKLSTWRTDVVRWECCAGMGVHVQEEKLTFK